MNNVNKGYLVVGSVTVLLGIILSLTFKTVSSTLGDSTMPSQRAQQIAAELKKEKDLNQQLKTSNDELEKKIREYEESAANNDAYVNKLLNDALRYRSYAGYTALIGEGLIIDITEPKAIIEIGEGLGIANNTDLLLKMISTLNAAGAEAISINDKRITSFTEIERAGGHVMINGQPTNTPLTVKVIGNADYMNSALSIKNGIVDELRHYNFYVNIKKENEVVVQKTDKERDFKYSKPVDDKKE